LVIRTANGGGSRFGAQHSQSVENWAMSIPGLKVVAPSTPADVKGLIAAAVRDPDPVIVFEHKSLYPTKGEVPDGEHVDALGTAWRTRPSRPSSASWRRCAATSARGSRGVARASDSERTVRTPWSLRGLRDAERARKKGSAIACTDTGPRAARRYTRGHEGRPSQGRGPGRRRARGDGVPSARRPPVRHGAARDRRPRPAGGG